MSFKFTLSKEAWAMLEREAKEQNTTPEAILNGYLTSLFIEAATKAFDDGLNV